MISALQHAEAFGSKWLKVSLGYFTDNCDLQVLKQLLENSPVLLLVENDQTAQGGRIEPMLQFFQRVDLLGLRVGMTFDIGNWQWQGEPAPQAARQLGRWVRYVHCKAVQRRADGPRTAEQQRRAHGVVGIGRIGPARRPRRPAPCAARTGAAGRRAPCRTRSAAARGRATPPAGRAGP